MPRVALSVDMLDTGIDVREIVNLVFAKPVYSYTKFWQMIGRGTRLLETSKPKPWCTEKEVFLILDCWDNFEYFKLQPKGKELKPQLPLPVRLVGLRLDKIEKAIDLAQAHIAEREITKLRKQISQLPQSSVIIKEAASLLSRIDEENFWITLNHQRLELLRTEIKPLFRTVSEADFKAMRFERDLLEYSLAKLSEEKEKAEILKEDTDAIKANLIPPELTTKQMVEGLKSLYQQSLTDLEGLYGALNQKAFKAELDLSRVVLPVESTAEELNHEIHEIHENKSRVAV